MRVAKTYALLFVYALTAGCSAAVVKSDTIRTGNETYFRTVVAKGGLAPSIEYFVSTKNASRPLVLYIQGSGCNPVFFRMGAGGQYASTVFSLTTIARETQLPVMVVSKPYAPETFPTTPDSAEACPASFNKTFDLASWVAHIRKALDHAQSEGVYSSSKVLVIGFSEGATVAAALAALDARITHVALVGASGTTQLFDFVVQRYLRHEHDSARLADVGDLLIEVRKIYADPLSGDKFAWGHAYRRWSTFFASNSLNNVMRSSAKIYVVSGMADKSVPVISTEALIAGLQAAGRDVVVRRLPDANHSLMAAQADQKAAMDAAEDEYRRILHWFSANGY